MSNESMLAAAYRAANGDNPGAGRPAAAGSDFLRMTDHQAIEALQKTDRETRDRIWNDRYAASDDLQAEFPSVKEYAAFMNASCDGRVRILGKQPGLYRGEKGVSIAGGE